MSNELTNAVKFLLNHHMLHGDAHATQQAEFHLHAIDNQVPAEPPPAAKPMSTISIAVKK